MTKSESEETTRLKSFNFSIDFDFDFNESSNNKQLVELFKYVRPQWTEPSLIKYNVFTEGSTNRLIGFSYGEELDSSSFLMRIYGHNTELFIDRNSEINNICRLHENGLCPPIFCTFKNGICYGFIPGKPLCKEEVINNGPLTTRIARELARLHSISSSTNQESCLPKLFKKIFTILNQYASKFNKLLRELGISNVDMLEQEVQNILKVLFSLDSPIVFCHNDLLMKNIIFDKASDQVYFIDFEYSAFNFQCFDLANHFCEYSGQIPFELDLYPDKNHQLVWLAKYLKFYDQIMGNKQLITEKRIEQLYVQVCKSSLASHLLWGCWALVQSKYSKIDFDFVFYAKARLNAYLTFKDKFLSL